MKAWLASLGWRAVFVVLAASVAWGRAAPARAEIVDRVVAVVEDDAIFLSDVQRRMRPFRRQLDQVENSDERQAAERRLYLQQLEAMVNEALIRRAATRAHITVTDADVDRMINGMASQRHVTLQDIYDAVEAEGITRVEYRGFMEAEVLRLRVMNVRVRGRVNITENDVTEDYRRRVRELTDHAPFHAAHIFLTFPENPTAAQIADTLRRAEEVARLAHEGNDFVALAHQYSEDAATRDHGGDLGTIDPQDTQSEPPEWLVNAMRDLQPGQVSGAVRGENGYHIFRLIDRTEVHAPALTEIHQQVFGELLQREMDRQQQVYLRELRARSNVRVMP